jgi:sugar lactone lactonase YvrE
MILAAVSVFGSAAAVSQGQGQVSTPEVPPTDTTAENIPGVIRGGTKIEVVIASVPGHGDPGVTLQGTEGPIALPDGTMVFCETILARVGRVEKDGKESVFVDAALAGGPNGLTWAPRGRLVGATTAPGKVGVRVVYPKGSEAMLADNFEGKPFVRPNDLIADKKGGVYFTDPANAPNPSLPPAVYYLPPGGGKVIKVVDNVNPNGFDVQNNGTLTNRRNFAKYEGLPVTDGKVIGGGDGFTVDTQGRLYTAAAGKIQVFTPQGAYLGSITPSRRPQNLAFAGPDMKTLYIVGGGTVFKVQTLAQGIKSRGGK